MVLDFLSLAHAWPVEVEPWDYSMFNLNCTYLNYEIMTI